MHRYPRRCPHNITILSLKPRKAGIDEAVITYDLRLLACVAVAVALPFPFSSARRTRSSPESSSSLSFRVFAADVFFGCDGRESLSSAISTSEPDLALGGGFVAGAGAARFFGDGRGGASSSSSSSSSR